MKVVIRADASSVIGSGHVMRCLALADALRNAGHTAFFVCRRLPGDMQDVIKSNGFSADMLEAADVSGDRVETAAWLSRSGGADWLVVDHYGLDEAWETPMRAWCRRILVIDDLANRRHDCDILLDQNLRDDNPYQMLVPQQARQLMGPRFALLRREFLMAREGLSRRDGVVRRILVFFGGGDFNGETLKALDALAGLDPRGITVDVIVGASNPNQAQIAAKCVEANLNYHCQVSDMAQFLSRADLALGAGGVSSWERLALGVPALVVAVADNQVENMRQLEKHGVALALGRAEEVTPQRIAAALEATLSAPEALRAMSEKALTLVDAQGAARVVAEMLVSEDENGR